MKYTKPAVVHTMAALAVIENSDNPKAGMFDDSISNQATAPGYSADE